MFWLPIMLYLAICVFAFLALSSEKKPIAWIGRIVLPLMLLVYVWIPVDFISIFLWLIALIIALACIVFITYRIGKFVIQKLRGEYPTFSGLLTSIFSPTVAVAVLFISRSLVEISVYSANRYALDLAIKTKSEVDQTQRCEESSPAWPIAEYLGSDIEAIEYGRFGTTYRISYTCLSHDNTFIYQVRVNQDASFAVSSKPGDDIVVSYGHYANPVEVVLTKDTDLDALSRMPYD